MEPIDPGGEGELVVYAKDQPEYADLPSRRNADGRVRTRWTFTAAERLAIAAGADLELGLLTFGQPLQPIDLGITDDTAGAVCPICDAEWKQRMVSEAGALSYASWDYACGTRIIIRGEDRAIEPQQSAECLLRFQGLTTTEGSPA